MFAGAEPDLPLVVFDAHRLDSDARWDLRELARPLLLITRPDHLNELIAADAPFYGHAQTLAMHPPTTREWTHALSNIDQPMRPSDLDWLLQHTRARVGTTADVLELSTRERSPRTAWQLAVRGTMPRAYDILTLARAVHEYAPTLLIAIANGRKPYPSMPGAPDRRIAGAMRKLHELDILERPAPRTSAIADPLLQGALQSISHSNNLRRASESWFDEDPATQDRRSRDASSR